VGEADGDVVGAGRAGFGCFLQDALELVVGDGGDDWRHDHVAGHPRIVQRAHRREALARRGRAGLQGAVYRGRQ
jgi:hypothetical protein